MTEKGKEFLKIPSEVRLEYRFSTGPYLGRFYRELRDNKRFVANKCGQCGRVLFPPRISCPDCMVRAADEWVEVGPRGTLLFFAKYGMEMYDSKTGKWEVRGGDLYNCLVELDGTVAEESCFDHWLLVEDIEKLREGMKVEPVFKEEGRTGFIMEDILYFKPVDE